MKTPSVPRPTNPATVAVAITWFAAERTPARISGSAFGTSTCQSDCHPVRPIPRAASRTSSGTLSMPATVFSTTGGIASRTRAMSTGHTDSGCQRKTIVTTPMVGIARQIPATLAATNRPRPVCPMARPMGRAMATATTVAMNEYQRCCRMRWPMPFSPDQLSGLNSHPRPSMMTFIGPRPRWARSRGDRPRASGPRRGGATGRVDDEVEDQRQRHRRHEGAPDLDVDLADVAVGEHPPESPTSDDRADADQRHGADRRQAQAGDDAGQRQRQLDGTEALERPVAHRVGGPQHRLGHGAD